MDVLCLIRLFCDRYIMSFFVRFMIVSFATFQILRDLADQTCAGIGTSVVRHRGGREAINTEVVRHDNNTLELLDDTREPSIGPMPK